MLGNDICDLDWWFYVIWNRFLALNRQIFHLRSWKVLRTIINRMSLLPTFSPIKSMNITNSIYTFWTLTETAKQPRDAKIYFPQTLSRKVLSVSPSCWSFRKLQDVDWTKQLQGFVSPSPILFSPAPATVRMHFCELLVSSKSFIECNPNILPFGSKYVLCANLSTECFWLKMRFKLWWGHQNLFNLVMDICDFAKFHISWKLNKTWKSYLCTVK